MLAPKLRFKEFNDEWNYNLFNEIFEFIQNNSFSRDMLNYSENSKIYNIHYGDILTKYGEIIDFNLISNIVPKINNDISLSKFEDKSYLKNGDIIIADTAEDLTVGKSCEVVNLHCKALAGLHTIPCRPKFKFTSQYLGTYINSTSYHSQLIPYITGIKVSSISKNNIIKTKIYFPTIKEQEKISELFSLLNKKIELQQRKIEVLKMYKRRQISYFFNKSTSYSTCLLKNICQNISSNISLSNTENKFGKYKLYGANGIVGTTSSPLVSVPYIAIIKDGAGVGKSFICESNSSFLSTMTGIVPTQCTVEYLKIILDSINFSKYIVGSGIPHIYFNDYKNEKIKLIPYKDQLKLSEFLCAINIKIETLNSKLHILKDFKKSLLQQMFI